MQKDVLKRLNMSPFSPLPGITKGHRQTLAGYLMPANPFLTPSGYQTIELDDGDKLSLVENRPTKWRDSKRIILLVHGLNGSHDSKYNIRLARLFSKNGFLVFRMNLRGCGSGKGLAKLPYHSGRSEDTRAVLKWLKEHYPSSPVTQVGVSVGGNITLKMAGESLNAELALLDSVVAISPPIDLKASVKLITHKQNQFFDQHFVKGLVKEVHRHHQRFPELPTPSFPDKMTVYDFDDHYTAPRSGFNSALDYYQQCSAYPLLEQIRLPTLLLNSLDDPLISRDKYLKLPNTPFLETVITKRGGHVGWIGKTPEGLGIRWMDTLIYRWIDWHDRHSTMSS